MTRQGLDPLLETSTEKPTNESANAPDKGGQKPPDEPKVPDPGDIPNLSARKLYRIKSHKPLGGGGIEVIIDEVKVSRITKGFLGSEVVETLLIKDIGEVLVSQNPFFGSLQIHGGEWKSKPDKLDDPAKGPLAVPFLKKDEAKTARQIILGLVILCNQKVDTSLMDVEEVVHRAQELGRAR